MASRSLGTLTLDLVAKVGGFVEGMNKAERAAERRTRAIRKSFNRAAKAAAGYAKAAGVALTATAAITAAIVKRTADAIDSQAKLAQSLQTTVKGLQVTTRAGELAGVAFSGIEQATKDLTRRLSQAATGTGPAVAALERLGLEAENLLGLPLDERIRIINQALLDFVPAAERAAVAGQLFGEEGSLNLLRLAPESFARATREVELFGAALSEVDAVSVENANDALSSLGLISKGLSQQLTVQVAELLPAVVEKITEVIEEYGGLDDVVSNVFDNIITGAVVVAGSLRTPALAIQRIVAELWEGFRALPPWIQEVGLVGAIFGGKYWRTALVGLAAVGDDISAELAFIQQRMAQGMSIFRAVLFDANGEEFNEFKDKIEAARQAGIDVAGQQLPGPSIFGLLAGDPDGAEGDEWVERILARIEELRQRARRESMSVLEQEEAQRNAPVIPNVPGADATFPGAEGALIIKDFINGKAEVKEATEEMSQYAISAARNMQSAFADFLFDPFDKGLDGMLKSFADTLQRMAAEAAAAQVFDAIMGSSGEGGLGGFLQGIFGGGKAIGGGVSPGQIYEVGERGPEIFRSGGRQYMIPSSAGTVDPAGGGGNVIMNITTPDANSFRQSERQVARSARRGLQM